MNGRVGQAAGPPSTGDDDEQDQLHRIFWRPAHGQPRQGRDARSDPPIVVQVLSVVAFGVFSIVAIALAFAAFWLVGLVLAMVIASTWAGTRAFGGKRRWRHHRAARSVSDLAPSVSSARSSGNASFDAYRSEMLERLEQESVEFQGFLTRLREAHDAVEFDQFMDERASASRDTSSRDTARHTETAGY